MLDIWQKALALRDQLPGLTLLRVAPPGTPAEPGVVDFHAALMAQPDDRLVFGEPGRDDDVAAYFHTGGTTGTPKLVAHTHRGQLVAALGGAVLGDMRPSDTLTATLPLFHVGGTIFCGLSAFMAGMGLLDHVAGRPAQPGDGAGLLAPGRRSTAPRWSARCRPRSARCSKCRWTARTSAPCAPASAARRRCRRRWASASGRSPAATCSRSTA